MGPDEPNHGRGGDAMGDGAAWKMKDPALKWPKLTVNDYFNSRKSTWGLGGVWEPLGVIVQVFRGE